MYLDHFGLNQSPFKITPNTEFFYTGGNRGAILDALLYAIIHGEGIVKVTGEIGSGKTMLCRMLESMLPDNVEAIYLANPSLNRDEVFHAIAGELGLATEGKRGGEIMRLMQDYLIEKHAAGKQVVLLVEEAQAMPLDTLEEIRLLSNLETAHHKLLQIVLFGQLELDNHLNLPQMRQLKERITHGFKVPPLDQKDIPEYLMFRMRAAGYHGPDTFSAGAIKLITAASRGITRRINVLADKALLAAFSENTHNILPRHIKAAIEDSEFAVPPSGLPLKQIGFAAALLVLGIALGAGWQNLTGFPHKLETATPIAPPMAESATQSAPPSAMAQPTIQEKPAAISTPPPAKQDKPAQSAPSPLQQRLAATQSWLAGEDGARFTVQLLLLTDTGTESRLGSVLSRLDREIGLTQIYVYPTRITADHQFGITFGNFSSREHALASIDNLPPGYKKANYPKLRTIKGIRDEIAKQQMR
jgi:type II secretory pathway predicted ATPase ExeA